MPKKPLGVDLYDVVLARAETVEELSLAIDDWTDVLKDLRAKRNRAKKALLKASDAYEKRHGRMPRL